MHYVSRLAMTEEAMCAVFGERNSGAYKRSGGDVGGSGMWMPAVLLQTRPSAADSFITLSAAAASSQPGFVSDPDVLRVV